MTSALRWGWVVSTTPRPLYLRERPGTHCTGGCVCPRTGLDGCGKSRPPPGFDARTIQPVASRYNNKHTRCNLFHYLKCVTTFSQQKYIWRFKPCQTLCRVDGWMFTYITKCCSSGLCPKSLGYTVQEFGLHDPDDRATTILRKVDAYWITTA